VGWRAEGDGGRGIPRPLGEAGPSGRPCRNRGGDVATTMRGTRVDLPRRDPTAAVCHRAWGRAGATRSMTSARASRSEHRGDGEAIATGIARCGVKGRRGHGCACGLHYRLNM
jgi:hypothetical protein